MSSPRKKVRRRALTASSADPFVLYQRAVQSPQADLEFVERIYRREHSRAPRHLREDFCGTALLSATWVAGGRERTAEGFDIDPEPVAWGLAHNFDGRQGRADAARFTVHLKDVREAGTRPADLRLAFNFSYWVFKTRAELLAYFRAARASLAPGGLFAIDLYGGPDATEPMEEKRACRGFTYVWEQVEYWPGTGDYLCKIHFRFRDRTSLSPFTYRWRFWHLGELEDVLRDAGFTRVERYFEGTDKRGQGDGNFRRGLRGENCAAWLAYLVASD